MNNIFFDRMVWPFVIPCEFPRMTMQVYDFATFGSNELLGETVISLKK